MTDEQDSKATEQVEEQETSAKQTAAAENQGIEAQELDPELLRQKKIKKNY